MTQIWFCQSWEEKGHLLGEFWGQNDVEQDIIDSREMAPKLMGKNSAEFGHHTVYEKFGALCLG